jgi:hypothetical protein
VSPRDAHRASRSPSTPMHVYRCPVQNVVETCIAVKARLGNVWSAKDVLILTHRNPVRSLVYLSGILIATHGCPCRQHKEADVIDAIRRRLRSSTMPSLLEGGRQHLCFVSGLAAPEGGWYIADDRDFFMQGTLLARAC